MSNMSTKTIQKVDDSEIFKMHAFIAIIDRMADEMLNSQFNLSYSQLMILFMVDKRKEIIQKDISNCLGVTEAAISKQIENMVQVGYLLRTPDPTNRRKNQIVLTAEGKDIFDRANLFLVQKAEDIFVVLGPEERQVLDSVLDKLISKIQILLKTNS